MRVTVKTDVSRRGLRPAVELAQERPHGDRLRYMAGCRCDQCRKANSVYESQRQQARRAGDWNGIVVADKARKHLLKLSAAGVGRRAVAAATDVAETIICEIRSGRKTHIRARTERKILAVSADMASDHALIGAQESWRLIQEMLAAGFTKARIAREMGFVMPALQIGRDTVLVSTAHRIALIHRRLMNSDEVLVPAKTAQRLLQNLLEEGYRLERLAERLGVSVGECLVRRTRVTRGFEARVRALHEELTT